MTTTYFCLCLLSLLLTWNLFRPAVRQPILAMLSFGAGWMVGELTLYVLLLQILGTLIFVSAGAVVGASGALGLLLTLISWSGMIYHFFDSLKTGNRVEASLQVPLGFDYAQELRPDILQRIPRELDTARLLKPFSLHLPSVQRQKDIVYGNADGIDLKLDVYSSRDDPENAPVLLQIHGGGWTENWGDKNRQALPLMNQLAAMGWVCVSVNYRLSPAATWPAHIVDCKRGLKWIRENIRDYGGDPDFVIATGGSAGGHLSSLLALSANDPQFQPGFEDFDTSVNACVPFYGVYDFTDAAGVQFNSGLPDYTAQAVFKLEIQSNREVFEQASPMHRIHADAPPFFVVHGENDSLAGMPEANVFVERLRESSKETVAYHKVPRAQHAFDLIRSPHSEFVMYGVVRYVNYIHSKYQRLN